jgi:hypothetical protein
MFFPLHSGSKLDPDFDFISSAAPYIVEVKGVRQYFKDEWRKTVDSLEKAVSTWQKVRWDPLVTTLREQRDRRS